MALFKKKKKDDYKKIEQTEDQVEEVNPMEDLVEEEQVVEEQVEETDEDKELADLERKTQILKEKKKKKMEESQQNVRVVYLTEAEMLRELLIRVQSLEGWGKDITSYLKEKA